MKRSVCTAGLAVAVLLVAGCTSDNSGSAGTTAAATASAQISSEVSGPPTEPSGTTSAGGSELSSSPASEVMTSGSPESGAATSSGGTASASVQPANLDAQTTTWFTTLCQGLGPVAALPIPGTSGLDIAALQKVGPETLQETITALTSTSTKLQSTPPPTFQGGTEFADQVTSALGDSGSRLQALASTFQTISPTDPSALAQAVTQLPGELAKVIEPVQSLTDLPPDVAAATTQIPACQALNR